MKRFNLWKVTTILFLCLLNLQTTGQSITAVSDYEVAHIDDTIRLRYVLKGRIDSMKSFQAPVFPNFEVTGGPYQSNSTSLVMRNGDSIRTESVNITYDLKARKPGVFLLRAASFETQNGNTYYSNTITIAIELEKGRRHKTRDQPDLNDANKSAIQKFMAAEEEFKNPTLKHIRRSIETTTYPYILITGWIFYTSATEKFADSLMKDVHYFLNRRKDSKELNNFMEGETVSRYYYGVTDTINLRKNLTSIFHRAGTENKAAIMILQPKDWNLEDENYVFDGGYEIWDVMYAIQSDSMFKSGQTKNLEIAFKFRDSSKIETFNSFAKSKGYKVAKIRNPEENKSGGYYVVHYVKACLLNEKSIYKAIEILRAEGRKEKYNAAFYGLGFPD